MTLMHGEYPHIDTLWKRDMSAGQNKGTIMVNEWVNPEFEYLRKLDWIGTEKVDGTNIRACFFGALPTTPDFGGKTDNADIPPFLLARLFELFTDEERKAAVAKQFEAAIASDTPVTLYGEGYGARIQKGGGNYIPDGVDFVLFDVRVGDWWLRREAVEEVGANLRLRVVPVIYKGTLYDAHIKTANGFQSTWGDFTAEGLVLQPAVPLFNRKGERVIAKVKHQDYVDLSRRNPEEALRQGCYVPGAGSR